MVKGSAGRWMSYIEESKAHAVEWEMNNKSAGKRERERERERERDREREARHATQGRSKKGGGTCSPWYAS